MKMAWRTAIGAALLLSCASLGVAAAEGAGLFSADRGAVMPRRPARSPLAEEVFSEAGPVGDAFSEFSGSAELRSRAARIDIGRLPAARLDIAQGRAAHLNLNLFADADMEAVLERAVPSASGYSLTGRLADDPLSTVVLTVGDGLVVGTVWGRDGMYEIRSAGGAGEVRQLDPSGLPRCGLGTAPLGGSLEASASEHLHHAATGSSSGSRAAVDHRRPLTSIPPPMAPVGPSPQPLRADDGDVIDLLVVYPEFDRRTQGGIRAMHTWIEHAVAITNEAYRASGVVQRVALVAAVEVDYGARRRRSGFDDLGALRYPSDGIMDEVHKLRDSYAADIVALYLKAPVSYAYLLDPSSKDDRAWAFLHFSGNTLAHELGHVMGLAHSWRDPRSSIGVHPYSVGHLLDWKGSTGTIMAGRSVNLFSNPRRKYPDDESGIPLGVPGDEWPDDPENVRVGPADAVRSMNETRHMVANFRASAARCEYSLFADNDPMPTTGGEFKVRIETAPGCFWNARAEGGFISVLGASSGVGGGEITYLVGANDDWNREEAILTAGKVQVVKQLGSRPITPMDERSPGVQEMLLRQFKIDQGLTGPPYDPDELTASDLATLRELHIGEWWLKLDTLRPGDLDGLSNLVNLRIRASSLALHPGAFAGLSNLASLDLSSPSLVLHPGAFADLSNLVNLRMESPSLVLHPGAFGGLSNLPELAIWSSQQILRPGMFNGLSNLQSLILSLSLGSGVRTDAPVRVPPGVFEGLSNLYSLSFGVGAYPLEMRGAMFSGLTKLSVLHMARDRHTELRRNMFEGLANLKVLDLSGNHLENVEPGTFEGLSNLENLYMDGNVLKTLGAGWSNGLSNLRYLSLFNNNLVETPPLRSLESLATLWIEGNLISDIGPLLEYDWLGEGDFVNVLGNPLSEQTLQSHIPALERRGVQVLAYPSFSVLSTVVEEGRNANFHVSLLPRAPVDLTVPWVLRPGSAAAGEDYAAVPDRGELLFRAGETQGVISIPTNDDRLVEMDEIFAVVLDEPNAPPGLVPKGGDLLVISRSAGIAVIRDDDLTMSFGEPIAIDLVDAFHYPLGKPAILNVPIPGGGFRHWLGNGLAYSPVTYNPVTYEVKSKNPNVASAAMQDGVAVISANGPGMTTVTVTAADSHGQTATRTFVVTVKPPPKGSLWDGWRSVLLQPPSADGDEF